MRTQPRPAHFLRPGIIGQSRCGRCVRAGRRVPGTVLYLSLQRQHGAVDPWLQHRLWAATFAGYLLAARAIHAGLAAEFRKLANALHRGSVLHHFPDTFLKAPIVRNERPPFSRFAYVSLCAGLLILTACGGGGSAGYPRPGSAPATALTVSDPNAFLLFPNPQLQSDGSKQTDTAAYTQAYYAAIDPTSARDTLNKWKAANGFDSGTGTQVTVVFGDRRDLGYGRRMTARQNTDGTIAFYVEINLVQYALSQTRGDVQARLHPFEADAFGFSATAGFTRADQEAALKVINKMILCSYPLPTPSALPEDACRRPAIESEWQGTAADFIKAAYGGDGLPNATFSDTYVPFAWTSAGPTTLYQSVIAPACRTCHMMRGTGAQSDLDFTSFAKFQSYADRTKAHVVDRGNMPLAKIVFDAYYTSNRPDVMATYLQGEGYAVRDSAGVPLRPGRPVADPGPDRVVRQGATALSAAMSLFANSYAWSLISGPNGATPATGATLSNANSAQPTFTASSDGSYVLQLVAGNGTTQSAPAQLTLVVNNALTPAPSTIRFADIKAAIQGGQCTNCHSPSGTLPRPPLFYTNYDRNGDGVVDATDDAWFYAEIRSRINFTDIVASPLLRKPSGHHHGGNAQLGFNDTLSPGSSGRSNYDLFLNWILNGAPQ